SSAGCWPLHNLPGCCSHSIGPSGRCRRCLRTNSTVPVHRSWVTRANWATWSYRGRPKTTLPPNCCRPASGAP
ncbi:AAEL010717-PA, partial [Aedes aegypti]